MKFLLKLNNLKLTGILILLVLPACSKNGKSGEEQAEGRRLEYTHQVTFLNNKGNSIVTIDVAVADEPRERNLGLMDVRSLPPNKGMLFIFEEQQPLSFWMANTPLPLDIIFVNKDKEIVRIHHSAEPFSEENFTSGEPAKYVIETNGGFSISHDIQERMQVEWGDL